MPALLLQPLVENAIRHGIARRAGAGTIRITAREREGALQLQVHDEGAARIVSDARENGGIGRQLQRARCPLERLLFGTDAGLRPEPLQLDAHEVAFCDPRGPVHHLDVRYAARARPGAQEQVSDESLALRWWPVDALPELEPQMHDLIALARQSTESPEGKTSSDGGRGRRDASVLPAR